MTRVSRLRLILLNFGAGGGGLWHSGGVPTIKFVGADCGADGGDKDLRFGIAIGVDPVLWTMAVVNDILLAFLTRSWKPIALRLSRSFDYTGIPHLHSLM